MVNQKRRLSGLIMGQRFLKDSDGDRIPDHLDCDPHDPNKHGWLDKVKNIIRPKPAPKQEIKKEVIPPQYSGTIVTDYKSGESVKTDTTNGVVTKITYRGGGGSTQTPITPTTTITTTTTTTPTTPVKIKAGGGVTIGTGRDAITYIGKSFIPNVGMTANEYVRKTRQEAVDRGDLNIKNWGKVSFRGEIPSGWGGEVTSTPTTTPNIKVTQPTKSDNIIVKNLIGAREDTSLLSWSGFKEGASSLYGDVKKIFMVDEGAKKVMPVLDVVDTKVRETISPPTSAEKDLAKLEKQYQLEVSSFNKQVEKYNKNPASETEYNNLVNMEQRLKYKQEQLENIGKITKDVKESSIKTFANSVATGFILSPVSLAKTGVSLITSPVETIQGTISGIKNLPKQIKEAPASTTGELIGGIAGSIVMGQVAGSVFNKFKTPKPRVVKPKASVSGTLDDTIKTGTDASGNTIYYTEGKILSNTISPRTGKFIRPTETKVFTQTVVSSSDDVIKTGSSTKGITTTNRWLGVKPDKVTATARVTEVKTTGNFNPIDDSSRVFEGTARSVSKQTGRINVKLTDDTGIIKFTRTPSSNELETLSNIKTSSGQQVQTTKIFNLGKDVKLSVEGTSTPTASIVLSDTSDVAGNLLNKNLGSQLSSVFEPSKLTTDGFLNLGSGSKTVLSSGTQSTAQATAFSGFKALEKSIISKATKPIIINAKTIPITTKPLSLGLSLSTLSKETQRPVITERQITSPSFSSITSSSSKEKERNKTTPMSISTSLSTSAFTERTAEAQIVTPATALKSTTLQVMQPIQPNTPSPVSPRIINPPFERITPPTDFMFERKAKPKEEPTPYNVYILRENGVPKKGWDKVAGNVPYQSALGIGAKEVDNSPSTQFKVEPTTGKINRVINNAWGILQNKFESYAKRSGVKIATPRTYTEKAQFRFDKPGEIRNIQPTKMSDLIGGSNFLKKKKRGFRI